MDVDQGGEDQIVHRAQRDLGHGNVTPPGEIVKEVGHCVCSFAAYAGDTSIIQETGVMCNRFSAGMERSFSVYGPAAGMVTGTGAGYGEVKIW